VLAGWSGADADLPTVQAAHAERAALERAAGGASRPGPR